MVNVSDDRPENKVAGFQCACEHVAAEIGKRVCTVAERRLLNKIESDDRKGLIDPLSFEKKHGKVTTEPAIHEIPRADLYWSKHEWIARRCTYRIKNGGLIFKTSGR